MPTLNSIETFKAAFGGGTRANRFEVTNGFPTLSAADWPVKDIIIPDNETKFKIFATSLPKAELGTIMVPYRGRLLNFAGDRTYGSWAVTVYDDNNNNSLWKAFNLWKEYLDGHRTHTVANNDFSYKSLQTTWTLNQLDLNGSASAPPPAPATAPIRTIQLKNCWPSQIGSLDLDMAKADQCIFNVVMVFDWFEITKGI